jgi:hypothetical protein
VDIFENDSDNPSAESAEEKQGYEGKTDRGPESCFVLHRVRKHDIALPTFDVPRQFLGLMPVSHVIEQIIPLAVACRAILMVHEISPIRS